MGERPTPSPPPWRPPCASSAPTGPAGAPSATTPCTRPPAAAAAPGSLVRVEPWTDTGRYAVEPGLALSRRARVGLCAVALPAARRPPPPRAPRRLGPRAHGTSGVFAECAPSHVRNLWAHFSAPYALALAGFAVVASDYAGLGVARGFDGAPVVHPYLAAPAAANDVLYAAAATRAAFPRALADHFAVVGHSQGGAAAWAAAQQQLVARVPGYLGAVTVAPVTDPIEHAALAPRFRLGLLQAARSIVSVLGNVTLSSVLTPAGARLLGLVDCVQGCNSVWTAALAAVQASEPRRALVRDDFLRSADARRFARPSTAGGRDFAGPLLVLQGTADQVCPESLTTEYVNRTCCDFPGRPLRYVKARAMGHDSILYATQQIWIDWLNRRFADAERRHRREGREPPGACSVEEIGADAPRPLRQYQQGLTYVLEYTSDGVRVA